MSTNVSVEVSPDTTTRPVFTSVSQATRPSGSSRMTASSTPSEIWSAILSGWPSVTDSEVNRYSFSASLGLIGSGSAPRSGSDVIGARRSAEMPETGSAKGIGGRLAALLLAPVVVDHERHALEPVALAQAVLEEEAVVAREQSPVGHLDREARRACLELGHVKQPQPLAAHRRRLPRRLDVGHEAVELGCRNALVRAVGEVERLGHQPLHPAAGLGADRDHLGSQAQPH